MNLTELICRRAARADAVAFDVFDTLIKRDTATPADLFRLRGEAFYTARIEAEREARAVKGGEVTLAEIYARPCLAGYDPAQECAAELAACVPYRPVLDAVQQLRRQGKKLYYISDMYLPQAQIDVMLRRVCPHCSRAGRHWDFQCWGRLPWHFATGCMTGGLHTRPQGFISSRGICI